LDATGNQTQVSRQGVGSYAITVGLGTNGDYEVTFHLKQPQPALLTALASGFSPVYPCHVPAAQMRQHPIGTGPFKFVEFKPNEYIKVARNSDYWKKDRPYLDGIEYQIIKNVATGSLAFVSGKVDMTSWYFLQVPMLNDINKQMGQDLCRMAPTNVLRSVIINREAAPFGKPEVRRARSRILRCTHLMRRRARGVR
jgi:peptide/nickel transport system substrate-binding protein